MADVEFIPKNGGGPACGCEIETHSQHEAKPTCGSQSGCPNARTERQFPAVRPVDFSSPKASAPRSAPAALAEG